MIPSASWLIADHTLVLEHPRTAVAISLAIGGLASQAAGVLGEIGFGAKAVIAMGITSIVFGMMYFLAPT